MRKKAANGYWWRQEPIGATQTWEWHGYANSWVDVTGQKIQSVSGGAHLGGGLWINTLDYARVGQLILKQRSMERYRDTSKNMDCRLHSALFYCGFFTGIFGD